jgi:anti-sigma B factor antagonist
MMLNTEVSRFDDGVVGISCYGRFTMGTRLSETEGLINSLIENGTRKLVLDLTNVDFVDSAGLGIIMRTLGEIEQRGGKFRIAGPTAQVRRLFEMTHTLPILSVDPDLGTSLRMLHGSGDAAEGQTA